ncbi:MAG: DnaJ domain-containing protein [Clostridia bacterium]|nr:DnaJ domain-containing protein [Clostridia bacterium]
MTEIEIALALNELDLDSFENTLTSKDINNQFRKLMVFYHPDHNNTDAFSDGEKAKKVNAARDFLIENLDAVNAYIRKKFNKQTDEDRFQEKAAREAEEQAYRQQQQYEEERRRKEEEDRRTRDIIEQHKREQEAIKRMEERLERQRQAELAAVMEKRRKRDKVGKIFALIMSPIALILTVLTAICGGFGSFDGVPVTAYNIFLCGIIFILEGIPATRRQIFTRFLCPFLLFAMFILFLASTGL